MNRNELEDLSDGSVVANENYAFIKNHPSEYSEWRGTNGGYYSSAVLAQRHPDVRVLRWGPKHGRRS
jgi:hypothetical protein